MVSFTARLTSLILQQYKIGFKVELKYNKVVVASKVMENSDKRLFSVCRYENGTSNKCGK